VGITNDSLVYDPVALKDQVGNVLRNYSQSALVEEYVDGREFTVSFLGNGKPTVLPIVEISFDYLPQGINKIDSYEVKWIFDNPDNPVDPVKCPANLDDKLKKRIEKAALKTYSALGCVDFCRIDIRLDNQGQPNILDVNALPGIIPDPKQNSRFPKACYTAGMTYEEIIKNIMDSAFKRYNLRR
jgi:D-alanine-D-alanine ligase